MAWVLFREQAWADLEELGAFIAKDNPAAADEVVRQLRFSFETTCPHATIGSPSKEDQDERTAAHLAVTCVP